MGRLLRVRAGESGKVEKERGGRKREKRERKTINFSNNSCK